MRHVPPLLRLCQCQQHWPSVSSHGLRAVGGGVGEEAVTKSFPHTPTPTEDLSRAQWDTKDRWAGRGGVPSHV